jgi:hypothetical protein
MPMLDRPGYITSLLPPVGVYTHSMVVDYPDYGEIGCSVPPPSCRTYSESAMAQARRDMRMVMRTFPRLAPYGFVDPRKSKRELHDILDQKIPMADRCIEDFRLQRADR